MNWLDWLIAAIVAISAFQGLRRGLLASLAGLVGLLAGLFVAYTNYRALAEYLTTNWHLEEKIKPLVMQLLKIFMPSDGFVQSALQSGKLMSLENAAANGLTNIGDYLVNSFTNILLESLCFLVLLVSTTWLINFVGIVLTSVARFSLLGPPNHLGGLLFGVVRGVVIVTIILALMAPFQNATDKQTETPGDVLRRSDAFEDSMLLPYFEQLLEIIERPLHTGTIVMR